MLILRGTQPEYAPSHLAMTVEWQCSVSLADHFLLLTCSNHGQLIVLLFLTMVSSINCSTEGINQIHVPLKEQFQRSVSDIRPDPRKARSSYL